MKKYFLYDDSQIGPFDIEDLKSKNLKRDTPVWFEGLKEWTTIGDVEELKGIITAIPPPFAVKTKISVDRPKQSSTLGRRLLILGVTIVLGLIGLYIYNQIQHQHYQNRRQEQVNVEEDTKEMLRINITSYVTAERSDYTYSQLGGIYNLKIFVTNSTDYLIDNVKVRVIYLKANGDVWDSRTIDFNLLDPHTKNTIKVPDTERGTSVKYEIVSIKSTALGVN